MGQVSRSAVLKEEQAAVDHVYDCYQRQQLANMALTTPRNWDQDDPESGTPFIPEVPPELRGIYPDLGRESLVFMRVDVEEPDERETFYIGRRTVKDPVTTDRVVISWSSPAAIRWSLALPSQPGEVRLRRRLRCEQRRVLGYSDDLVTSIKPATDAAPAEPQPISIPNSPESTSPAATVTSTDDFLLQELDRARDGSMRDIVETIQRDQLMLVADEREGVLVIQGGPGTGKTAVGLHRVTWLLNPENKHFKPEDVLVIGPNKEFLSYVGSVLPRLGNRDVTILAMDKLWSSEAEGEDTLEARRVKSDLRMAPVLRRAVNLMVNLKPLQSAKSGSLSVELNGLTLTILGEDIEQIIQGALGSPGPFRGRRTKAVDQLVDRLLQAYAEERPGDRLDANVRDELSGAASFVRLLNSIWPSHSAAHILRTLYSSRTLLSAAAADVFTDEEQQYLWRGQGEPLTLDDLVLMDELEFLLTGIGPRRFRHLVIDEAQDLTPMQARALKRRCPSGSITVLGDLTQATGPHIYQRWDLLASTLAERGRWGLAELTVGYRVPREVMDFAAPLAASIAPDVVFPESIRPTNRAAVVKLLVKPWQLLDKAIEQALSLTGTDENGEQSRSIVLIVPDNADWMGEVEQRLAQAQQQASEHAKAIRILPAALTKGLEFDHVIVLDPASIAEQGPTGLHQLYVAITRCTQSLTIVHTAPLPRELTSGPVPAELGGAFGNSDRQCSRFNADGTRCTHRTSQPDGWCRKGGCDGYRQSSPTQTGSQYKSLKVSPHADVHARLSLSDEQLRRVTVTYNARSQFVDQHGGEEAEAEVELQRTLAEFIETARHIRQGDYWLLDQDGYRLVLSSNGSAITAYRTVHADRSFAQYKAGVPSRVSRHERAARRAAIGERPEPGPHFIELGQLHDIDLASLYLSTQAADQFDRLVQGGRDLNDTEFVAVARQRFKADLDRDMLVAQDSRFLVIGETLTWALSLDGRSVKFVRSHSPNDLDVIELLKANWGRLPTYLTDSDLIGSWVEGTVADSAGAGRFYLETDQYPSGRVVLCLRGQDPVPARGSDVEAWIFQQTPDSLLASVNEFGRLPISEAMRARYTEALTVFDELAGGATPNAADRLSELKGMANRCLRRDQGDWFSVWDVLGWPTRARLNSLATLAAQNTSCTRGGTCRRHAPGVGGRRSAGMAVRSVAKPYPALERCPPCHRDGGFSLGGGRSRGADGSRG